MPQKSYKNRPILSERAAFSGCGGRTRTYGLRVMSPTSCQLLHAAIFTYFPSMVPVTGLEPVRYRYRGILSPLCLPIPPHRRTSAIGRIPYVLVYVKCFSPITKNFDEKKKGNIGTPAAYADLYGLFSLRRCAENAAKKGAKGRRHSNGCNLSPWGCR